MTETPTDSKKSASNTVAESASIPKVARNHVFAWFRCRSGVHRSGPRVVRLAGAKVAPSKILWVEDKILSTSQGCKRLIEVHIKTMRNLIPRTVVVGSAWRPSRRRASRASVRCPRRCGRRGCQWKGARSATALAAIPEIIRNLGRTGRQVPTMRGLCRVGELSTTPRSIISTTLTILCWEKS